VGKRRLKSTVLQNSCQQAGMMLQHRTYNLSVTPSFFNEVVPLLKHNDTYISGCGYVNAFLTSTLGTGDGSPSRLGCWTAGAGDTQWVRERLTYPKAVHFIQVKSLSLQEIQPRFVSHASIVLTRATIPLRINGITRQVSENLDLRGA
jgi:hypothetical protein